MKLIRIVSELNNKIDEVLMVVPDSYDTSIVLNGVSDFIPEPTITEEAILYNEFGTKIQDGFDEYREYMG